MHYSQKLDKPALRKRFYELIECKYKQGGQLVNQLDIDESEMAYSLFLDSIIALPIDELFHFTEECDYGELYLIQAESLMFNSYYRLMPHIATPGMIAELHNRCGAMTMENIYFFFMSKWGINR